MGNLDLILFTYSKGTFSCSDYYAPGDSISSDVSQGGRNDVAYVTGQATQLTSRFSPYQTLLSWTCTKDISNVDNYDWTDFKNWQTNNGPLTGTWNNLSSNWAAQQHAQNPRDYTIADGAGLSGSGNGSGNDSSLYSFSLLMIIFYIGLLI